MTVFNEAWVPNDAVAVTPHATNEQSGSALYVGGAGNVELVTKAGSTVIFQDVPAGSTLWIAFRKVLAANTTATKMVRSF